MGLTKINYINYYICFQLKLVSMKILKRSFLLLLAIATGIVAVNYPRLNIIAGYSAKNMSSSVYLAGRGLEFTDIHDNNFDLIKFADDNVNQTEKSASAAVFGLLTRKAIFREGLGSVLLLDKTINTKPLIPKRSEPDNINSYSVGNAAQKDTLFSSVNYEQLHKSVAKIFNDTNKTRAVVVIHKNQIIAEKYAEGFDKDSRILGWSMTKSITATVFGVLQAQGKLNVQHKAPIASWKNDSRKEITIHNLLQMNSGLEWDENYNTISDVSKMLFLERDMTTSQIHKPFVGKPNETWNYSSGTSNLLSGILRSQFNTHQEYLDFWYDELIDKIGMNSMVIETDLSGNYVGSSYAWATPRDWGKFGLLYLNNGNWNGEQLFDKSWVAYVTTPTPTSNGEYGAHFWLNAEGQFPDIPNNMFSANGYQGQRVFIFPDQDLVVVRMGLRSMDYNAFLKEVIQAIE
mgnify:CR=1 FL=1